MKIILFEDNQCVNLRPVGLFRPLFEISVGSLRLRNLVEETGIPVLDIRREHFLDENHTNPDLGAFKGEPLLFINASVEPDARYIETIRKLIKAGDPFITTSGNRVAACLVVPDKNFPETLSSDTISQELLNMSIPLEPELFKTIDWPHEFIESHVRIFDTNIEYIASLYPYKELCSGVFHGRDANIHSSCAFNTENGPIIIGDGVTIMPFSYLEGPVYIGKGTLIIEHSSIKERTAIGDRCKVGGEVEASTIESHSNKQHRGFLGHSLVGSWVNLGAGTTSSDLKNTYGKVRMHYGLKRMETGMQFLGAIIGDFAKTAINTSLFTSKTIGVCSMIYGMVTTNVPSFSNYARSFGQITEISLEQVLITQARMFSRRDVKQTPYDIELMKRVFEMTKQERVIGEEQINF